MRTVAAHELSYVIVTPNSSLQPANPQASCTQSALVCLVTTHYFFSFPLKIFFFNYLEILVLSGCTQVLPPLRVSNDRMVKDLLDLQGRKTRACSLHQELGQNSMSSKKVCWLVLVQRESFRNAAFCFGESTCFAAFRLK